MYLAMKFRAILICVLLAIATNSLTQTKTSAVGTWKLDVSHSEFGTEAAPKSATIHFIKDTPDALSWRVNIVDDKGNAFSYSWSGPKDGSMHPVMQSGKVIGKQSAKTDADGALLRHGEEADGLTFDSRSTLSADGKTIEDQISAKSKDGSQAKSKYIYTRNP